MRRIYESNALERDDEEPHIPSRRDDEVEPQAMRSVPSGTLSNLLFPMGLRQRLISIDVSTPEQEYAVGAGVPFEVTMKNSMPFPVTLRTRSPVLWTWAVDGAREASRVQVRTPPDDAKGFRFERGERKRIRKRWDGTFRTAPDEWRQADPGEHTISVAMNTDDAEDYGLTDEVTVRLLPE